MSSTEPVPGGRTTSPVHVPVLLDRVTDLLAPACAADGAVLVDATLGLAGHSLALLDAHPGLRLIGLDRDVVVVGVDTRFEIWDAATWDAYVAEQEATYADMESEGMPTLS